ncbi:hypothetical protein EDB80DRAFT_877571 [Ilyonectria destructans]|nr:hypothetical protein EDB80DRAFT_877571 [Ilyonectria destructans]
MNLEIKARRIFNTCSEKIPRLPSATRSKRLTMAVHFAARSGTLVEMVGTQQRILPTMGSMASISNTTGIMEAASESRKRLCRFIMYEESDTALPTVQVSADESLEFGRSQLSVCRAHRRSLSSASEPVPSGRLPTRFIKIDKSGGDWILKLVENGSEVEAYAALSYSWGGSQEPLSERGWAFQEYLFSNRILFYESYRLRWLCSCNDGYATKQKFWYGNIQPEHHGENEDGQPGNINGMPWQNAKESIKDWYNHVERFSRRKLTKFVDKLPAILGVLLNGDASPTSWCFSRSSLVYHVRKYAEAPQSVVVVDLVGGKSRHVLLPEIFGIASGYHD